VGSNGESKSNWLNLCFWNVTAPSNSLLLSCSQFVAGYQDSRFGYFVKNYACLYTSKATNLGLASAARAFRTSGELLPHDNMLSRPSTEFVDAEVE